MRGGDLLLGLIVLSQGALVYAQLPGAYSQSVKGRPFRADFEETIIRTDASGKEERSETRGFLARDVEGRTVRVTQGVGMAEQVQYFLVNDPRGHQSARWNSRERVASITHYRTPTASQLATGNYVKTFPTPGYCDSPQGTQKQDLGKRKINHIAAHGCRIVLTRPLTNEGLWAQYTAEEWVSTDLGLMVLTVIDDPRRSSRWTLKNLKKKAPDEMLFRVPDNYIVKDIDGSAGTP